MYCASNFLFPLFNIILKQTKTCQNICWIIIGVILTSSLLTFLTMKQLDIYTYISIDHVNVKWVVNEILNVLLHSLISLLQGLIDACCCKVFYQSLVDGFYPIPSCNIHLNPSSCQYQCPCPYSPSTI